MATFSNIGPLLQVKLQKAIKELPTVLVNEAVNWTKDNFTRQGFPNTGFERWKPRKAGSKRNKGRAILVDTGRLKRSIRPISINTLQATFGSDVPYARAHNHGFTGTVNVAAHKRAKIGTVKTSTGKTGKVGKKKTITGTTMVRAHQRQMHMPRRRFIGYSRVLNSILYHKATVHIGRQLKS